MFQFIVSIGESISYMLQSISSAPSSTAYFKVHTAVVTRLVAALSVVSLFCLLRTSLKRRRRKKLEREHRCQQEEYVEKFGNSVRFGLDIGGTLCKLVYYEPDEVDAAHALNKDKVDTFIKSNLSYGLTGIRDTRLELRSAALKGRLHFIKFQTAAMQSFIDIVKMNELAPQPSPEKMKAAAAQRNDEQTTATTTALSSSCPRHLHALISSSASVLAFTSSPSTTTITTTTSATGEVEDKHAHCRPIRSVSMSDARPEMFSLTTSMPSTAPVTASATPPFTYSTNLTSSTTPTLTSLSNDSQLISSLSSTLSSQSTVCSASASESSQQRQQRDARLQSIEGLQPIVSESMTRLKSEEQIAQTTNNAHFALPSSQSTAPTASPHLPTLSPSKSSPCTTASKPQHNNNDTPWLAAFPATTPPYSPSVCATGGGAFKFESLFKSQLSVELFITDELESLVRGIDFMVHQVPDECYYLSQFRFRQPVEETVYRNVSYPYLVVNIGSGVSILKVGGPNSFERVGGTSLGGGTFYGLCRALTGCSSFEEALQMAEQGRSQAVDLLVGDIYGGDYTQLGLSASAVASSFGKLVRSDAIQQCNKNDLAKASLIMITNNIGSLANLFAHKVLHIPQIIFVGNFLTNNEIAKRGLAFATDYWSQQTAKALFLKHEGYFGAVGTMLFE